MSFLYIITSRFSSEIRHKPVEKVMLVPVLSSDLWHRRADRDLAVLCISGLKLLSRPQAAMTRSMTVGICSPVGKRRPNRMGLRQS